MAIGLVVMHWDDRIGADTLGSYPEDVSISQKTEMQIFAQHAYSGNPGIVSISMGSKNVCSYYTGQEHNIYILVVTEPDEDPDAFEDGLIDISHEILKDLDKKVIQKLLPHLFQRLMVYPSMTSEQALASIYGNDMQRAILLRLREEGFLPKSEIEIWVKDQLNISMLDLDNLLASMIKNDIVKISSVKGVNTDVIFLAEDILLLRLPVTNFLLEPSKHHMPKAFEKAYHEEAQHFFEHYVPSEEDNVRIVNEVLLDSSVYEAFKLLRKTVVTKNDLEKLKKKGLEDVNTVLTTLWELNMITVMQAEHGPEYYALLTDFHISTFYPHYNADNIRREYIEHSKSKQELLKAIDVMKDEYYHKEEKSKKEAKVEGI